MSVARRASRHGDAWQARSFEQNLQFWKDMEVCLMATIPISAPGFRVTTISAPGFRVIKYLASAQCSTGARARPDATVASRAALASCAAARCARTTHTRAACLGRHAANPCLNRHKGTGSRV